MDNRPAGLLGLFGDAEPSMRFAGLLGQPEAQYLPEIQVMSSSQPGDDAHQFVQHQLQTGEPQMRQNYEPEVADKALEIGAHVPPLPWIAAMGAYPDGHGGLRPGIYEKIEKGRYSDAAIDALSLAGGVAASRYIMPRVFSFFSTAKPAVKPVKE